MRTPAKWGDGLGSFNVWALFTQPVCSRLWSSCTLKTQSNTDHLPATMVLRSDRGHKMVVCPVASMSRGAAVRQGEALKQKGKITQHTRHGNAAEIREMPIE